MISEAELVFIYARQLIDSNPGMTKVQAIQEVNNNLFGDPKAKAALLAITEAIWNHGNADRTFRLLTIEQKCGLANCNPDVPGIMNLIDRIERTIVENNDGPR